MATIQSNTNVAPFRGSTYTFSYILYTVYILTEHKQLTTGVHNPWHWNEITFDENRILVIIIITVIMKYKIQMKIWLKLYKLRNNTVEGHKFV
jgi:hypothetical protein